MNIIIAGAGKVGFNLAKTLSITHNVIVIDKNVDALNSIQENLDIMPIYGNVEDFNTFKDIHYDTIDLFIAVTNLDNINLIASMTIDLVLNVKRKFIRLQKHYFDHNLIKEKLNIEQFIFPLQLASNTILSLLKYPKANNVKTFNYTDYKLISMMLPYDFITQTFEFEIFKIIGIERNKEFFIPKNNLVEIQANDLVYYFGLEEDMKLISQDIDSTIQKCVVFGGDKLGISISKDLLNLGCEVKLIEKDLILCEKADEKLKGEADIINFKYGSHEIFEDEGLNKADIFITTTNNDEFNIIKCLEARDSGVQKVVAINNEMEYYNLMHSLNITAVRGPKMSAYHKIMEEISSTGVVIKKHFCGGKATVFMRKIFHNSKLIGKKIKPLKLNHSTFFYIKNQYLQTLQDKIILEENDLIISFCIEKDSEKVQKWIYEL
jgi:trk system potassium uptake protein TrkA